jgi:lysophospholipase L1-like esterase
VQLATIPVSGLPSYQTRVSVVNVGDFTLRPSTGFAPDGATIVSASDGRQWVLSTRAFTPVVQATNFGNSSGRALNGVLVAYKPLFANQTSYTATWQAGQYKEVSIRINNKSGTATGFGMTLGGLSGTYKELILYNGQSAPTTPSADGNFTTWGIGMGASPWRVRGEIDLDSVGYKHAELTTINPNGLGAGVMLSYRMVLQHDDMTNDVTGITVSFTGGFCTGSIEIRGVPFIAPSTTTIMFMGDSITEGGVSGGFRQKIVTELGQYMPVGALTTDAPVVVPFPRDRIHHEGHGGQASSYFVTNIAAIWAATPAAYVTYLIGANDAIAGTPAATTAANIATVLDYIHTQSPNTFIWVGLVTNAVSSQPAWNALLDAQRPLVSAVCATRPWTKAVTLPHLSDAQLDGSVHPVDDVAYDLLADAWIAAMRPA